jgi:predicted  nucleic acid-binding Zn-ribbon protein
MTEVETEDEYYYEFQARYNQLQNDYNTLLQEYKNVLIEKSKLKNDVEALALENSSFSETIREMTEKKLESRSKWRFYHDKKREISAKYPEKTYYEIKKYTDSLFIELKNHNI